MATWRIGVGLMGLEEKLPSGFLLTTVEKLASYMRRNSLWPATFGLACCAIEMMAIGSAQKVRHLSFWNGSLPRFASTSRFDDCCRSRLTEDGAGCSPDLRSNG